MNDLDLNEHCMAVRIISETLPVLQRDSREHDLFMALSNIEKLAHEAQEILNRRKYNKEN